jgi:hypothetical protein
MNSQEIQKTLFLPNLEDLPKHFILVSLSFFSFGSDENLSDSKFIWLVQLCVTQSSYLRRISSLVKLSFSFS